VEQGRNHAVKVGGSGWVTDGTRVEEGVGTVAVAAPGFSNEGCGLRIMRKVVGQSKFLGVLTPLPNPPVVAPLGWRPLNGRPGLRVAVWPQGQSPVCAGLSLRPIGYTPALSVTQNAAAAAVCVSRRYIGAYK